MFLGSIAKALRTASFIEHLRCDCFCEFDEVNFHKCSVLGICRHSLLEQKHNVGWVLLRSVVDLAKVCSLNIISRNHSNLFLLIKIQKTKTCPKKNIATRAVCPDTKMLTVQTGFFPLRNVYFDTMQQITELFQLSSSL